MAYSKRDIMEMIARKAKEAGIDPTHALTMASIETGGTFDPGLTSPTGYKGLYQFGPNEWKMFGAGGDINDPDANFNGFVGYHGEIKDQLKAALGRDPTPQELYLGWQQGAKGAADLIKNPEKRVTDVVPAANVLANGGNVGMTAGDFAKLWEDKYNEHRGGIVPDMPPSQYVGTVAPPAMANAPNAPSPIPDAPPPSINPAGLLSPRYSPYATSVQTGMGLMAAGQPQQPAQQGIPGLLQPGRPSLDVGLPNFRNPLNRGLLG